MPDIKLNVFSLDAPWVEKLIDVVSRGLGGLTARHMAKQLTAGKTHEIREIAAAIAEANGMPVRVEYIDGNLSILPREEITYPEDRPDIRAVEQFVQREAKRLLASERAAAYAAQDLAQRAEAGEAVSEQLVDETWTARYFERVASVRDDEVLRLWGRVLAGEVSMPGTFSLRALDVLSNMSQAEATLFEKAASHAFTVYVPLSDYPPGGVVLIAGAGSNREAKPHSLTHVETQHLIALGLLAAEISVFPVLTEDVDFRPLHFGAAYGIACVRGAATPPGRVPFDESNLRMMTPLGSELARLVTKSPEEAYVLDVARALYGKRVDVRVLAEHQGGQNFAREVVALRHGTDEAPPTP